MPRPLPDLKLLEGVVAPEILKALTLSAERLSKAGVRHALVGALAVGAWGYPRASRDVDFLVGDEAFDFHAGGVVTTVSGIPLQVGQVPIDTLSIHSDEDHLKAAIDHPCISENVAIAPVEAIFYLKLKSPRRKDAADLVELLIAGVDARKVEDYLRRHAPQFLDKFHDLRSEAEES